VLGAAREAGDFLVAAVSGAPVEQVTPGALEAPPLPLAAGEVVQAAVRVGQELPAVAELAALTWVG
jgi:hypothetical protein